MFLGSLSSEVFYLQIATVPMDMSPAQRECSLPLDSPGNIRTTSCAATFFTLLRVAGSRLHSISSVWRNRQIKGTLVCFPTRFRYLNNLHNQEQYRSGSSNVWHPSSSISEIKIFFYDLHVYAYKKLNVCPLGNRIWTLKIIGIRSLSELSYGSFLKKILY